MLQQPLYGLASVLVLGVAAQLVALRIKIPSILLLLVSGILMGPVLRAFRPTWSLEPDQLLGDALLPFVSLAVGLILYEGGLTLRFRDLGKDAAVMWKLVTIGVLVTAVVTSAAAYSLLGLSPKMSILLGAILTVSGPTVVGPLLAHVRPVGRVGPILRWEGIVIDPIGATLAALVFEIIRVSGEAGSVWEVVFHVSRAAALGGLVGAAAALVLGWLLRRYLIPDAMQNPVSVMSVIGVFALANIFGGESGLFAATAMGIVLGNQKAADIHHIVEFKENLRTLLLGALFILLAARLQAQDLLTVISPGAIAFVAVIILIARPLAVAASTIGSRTTLKERAFLAAVCPRGVVAAAVASVFALELGAQGVAGADRLSALVFGVIIGTVLVYGLSAAWVARRLGLSDRDPQGLVLVGAHAWARAIAETLAERDIRTVLIDVNRDNTATARLAGLEAHTRNIRDDSLTEQLDLTGVGRLLAITPNDEVNDLATHRLSRVFGRSGVFKLVPRKGAKEAEHGSPGRRLWSPEATFSNLQAAWNAGSRVKVTPITAAYTLEQYATDNPGAIPLFFMPEPGKLSIITADRGLEAKTGHVIGLAPEAAKSS